MAQMKNTAKHSFAQPWLCHGLVLLSLLTLAFLLRSTPAPGMRSRPRSSVRPSALRGPQLASTCPADAASDPAVVPQRPPQRYEMDGNDTINTDDNYIDLYDFVRLVQLHVYNRDPDGSTGGHGGRG
jgi:hypothetical protein